MDKQLHEAGAGGDGSGTDCARADEAQSEVEDMVEEDMVERAAGGPRDPPTSGLRWISKYFSVLWAGLCENDFFLVASR